jgi:hypothetical protein
MKGSAVDGESRERVWYFDLAGAIAAGAFVGFFSEVFAESGEIVPERVVAPMIVTGCSFLTAFLITGERQHVYKIPKWVLTSVLGALVCFASFHVVYYAYSNRVSESPSESFFFYLLRLLPDRLEGFVFLMPLDVLLALPAVGLAHLLGLQLSRARHLGTRST